MSYDAALTDEGDLTGGMSRLREPLDATAQRVRMALTVHLGDWPYDTGFGLPYAVWRAQKPPQTAAIRARVRAVILAVPRVVEVPTLTVVWDGDARSITVEGSVITREGDLGLTFTTSPRGGTLTPAVYRVRSIIPPR